MFGNYPLKILTAQTYYYKYNTQRRRIMSKVFIIENTNCQAISQTINKLAQKYGTPKLLFSDMDIDLEEMASIGEAISGHGNILKALAQKDIAAAGIPIGSTVDKVLLSQGQVVAVTEPVIPEDILFIEFEKDNATSLIVLVKYQSIVNPPQNLPTYSEFVKAARNLSEYYGEHYSEDETLRDLIQAVVTARFNHEQCS